MSTLPRPLVQQINEDQPRRENWSPELVALLDANIVAAPLSMPFLGKVIPKDKTQEFRWVRLSQGEHADTSRYLQMKQAGFRNATTDDVEVIIADVRAKDDIRSGDRILMKIRRDVYQAAIKFNTQETIRQVFRTSQGEAAPGTMTSETVAGLRVNSFAPTEEQIAEIQGRSSPANTSTVRKGA